MHVFHEPCCLCHSPTLRPWIDSLVLRGGVLEPGALELTEKERAKARAIMQLAFSVSSTEEPFSLRRGLCHIWRFLKLSIFLSFDRGSSPETTKATRLGSPSIEPVCR